MGAPVAKQYLELAGIPILARTLRVFDGHPLIDRIVITVPEGDTEHCSRTIVQPYRADKPVLIVPGGTTRRRSVHNGLKALENADFAAIHDGVRPFVSPAVITACLGAARISGAAIAAVPVRETVKRTHGNRLETVPRDDLWLAHTPQVFDYDLIVEAHEQAAREGFEGTDDASLVERLNRGVTIVEDSTDNIKITTPEDLEIARFIVRKPRFD